MVLSARARAYRKRKREAEAADVADPLTAATTSRSKRSKKHDNVRSSGRFSGEIFTIIVGGERRFAVHENILSKSPVFKAMCNGSFQESERKVIELPDDDPLSFEILLESFYKDCQSDEVWAEICDQQVPNEDARPEALADVYVLADKYQLPHIQDLIVSAFSEMDLSTEKPRAFFEVAETIYNNVPPNQGPFPAYLKENMPIALKDMDGDVMEKVIQLVKYGHDLAVEIFAAQALAWTGERERTEECMRALEHEKEAKEEQRRLRINAAVVQKRLQRSAADEKERLLLRVLNAGQETGDMKARWERNVYDMVAEMGSVISRPGALTRLYHRWAAQVKQVPVQ